MTKGKTSTKSPYQDEIEKARQLRDSGMDIHQIADRFGRPYRTVYGWVRNVRTETVIKGRNADRIRSMTDEELAKFIKSVQCYSRGWCEECSSIDGKYCNGIEEHEPYSKILEWLKQPMEE